MKLKKKVIYSSLFGAGMLLVSILYPIIPCKKIPNVPNPNTSYSLCSLNPDLTPTYDSLVSYFGYTPNITTAYFIVLISAFLVSFLFLSFIKRKKH